MTRGDISKSGWDNIRNKNYFVSRNFKDIQDNELKNKEYKNRISFESDSFVVKENPLMKNVEIVVSRYNENLEWINSYPFNQFQYTVYNKGINENFNKKNVNKIINLPNVGVCDHSYLYHIVSNYDENTLKEITIFLPGSVNMSNKINKAISILTKVLLKQSAFFIGEYTSNVFNFFKDFILDNHKTTYYDNLLLNNQCELIKSWIRPFGKWYLYNFGQITVPYYTMNGIFSFDKKDIMKHKKIRYERLISQLNAGRNMEAPHYMERSWGAICFPLLHTKVLLTYNNVQRNTFINRGLKSNFMKMNIGGSRPTSFTKKNNYRDIHIRNYLRAMMLRNKNMKKRKNRIFFRR